jgi:REP element-mobilizing transposase RayT
MALTAHDYHLSEIAFAYCYHAYLRCSTHRLRPYPPLETLTPELLNELTAPLDIHTLEARASPTILRALVSLRPSESIATCASKVKGRISRWLRGALALGQPEGLLAKGYFACTAGKSTAAQVDQYLQGQAEHHGYAARPVPPTFVETYAPSPAEAAALQADHSCTVLRFHLVLATWRRHGIFSEPEARAVAQRWRALQRKERFGLLKVSFVPDHVHVAVSVHPSVAPGPLAVLLMNSAQRVVWEQFAAAAVAARAERLWQPSAYVGGYGDLASPQIQAYVRRWEAAETKAGEEEPA